MLGRRWERIHIPIPPSPEISRALLDAFAERGITYVKDSTIAAVDAARHVTTWNDGRELPCDLLLAIPPRALVQPLTNPCPIYPRNFF